MPGQADPIRIPRQSEALYLLQRIRDEAHRFAITYHRQLRGKRMTKSCSTTSPVWARPAGSGWSRSSAAINAVRRRRSRARRRCRGCPTRWPSPSTRRPTGRRR